MTICMLPIVNWIHSRILMWFIPIQCARHTYFIPEICIYVFILPSFSRWSCCTLSADALLWHLYEWGRRGRDSQWCFNDGPVIAVMCAVHSQLGLRKGLQTKEIAPSSWQMPVSLTQLMSTWPSHSHRKYFSTPIVSLQKKKRPLRNIPLGNWNLCLCLASTFVKICISWHCNNGISGLKCLLYFSALESKLNYPWTLHCLQRKAADKPGGSTKEMWTQG